MNITDNLRIQYKTLNFEVDSILRVTKRNILRLIRDNKDFLIKHKVIRKNQLIIHKLKISFNQIENIKSFDNVKSLITDDNFDYTLKLRIFDKFNLKRMNLESFDSLPVEDKINLVDYLECIELKLINLQSYNNINMIFNHKLQFKNI